MKNDVITEPLMFVTIPVITGVVATGEKDEESGSEVANFKFLASGTISSGGSGS